MNVFEFVYSGDRKSPPECKDKAARFFASSRNQSVKNRSALFLHSGFMKIAIC
jgi:hypothetical protein